MKELTSKQKELIYQAYDNIIKGSATKTEITDAYYLITPNNVQEEMRMHKIIEWAENDKRQ
jgi:hypothetical protein